jgi:hypothetical protein
MEGINTNLVDKLLITPTNVKDGIRAGAFQGTGFLGKAPGVYVGEVFPYSIAPSNDGDSEILGGTIPANATVYLPLGNINFATIPGVSKLNSPLFPGGECIELDYERSLEFSANESCTITVSSMDRYLQKIVNQVSYSGGNDLTDIGVAKYFHSIKVKNNTSNSLTWSLFVGKVFGVPYNMLYNATDFVKMLIYDGNPLVYSDNIPSPLFWLPTITNGLSPTANAVATITTGFTRPTIDCTPLFDDGAPFVDRLFNGERILTFFTQHFGFGNLPPFASRDEQLQWLNGNNTTIIGVKPYSEGFTPWFR